MGGGSKQTQNTNATYNRGTSETVTNLPYTQPQFYNALYNYANNANAGGPQPLRTAFNFGPTFTQGMDPVVSSFYAKGLETLNNQNNTNNRQLATQLGVAGTGDNSALLATLQNNNRFATAGAANALIPAAAQMQRDYDVARAGIDTSRAGLQLQGDTAYNQAMANRYGTQLQAQGALFNTLASLAQAGAGRNVQEYGSGTTDVNSKTKKGLLSK